jgi:hypothetical protein
MLVLAIEDAVTEVVAQLAPLATAVNAKLLGAMS